MSSSPRQLPVLGVLHSFRADPLGFLTDSARTCGDMVGYRLFNLTFWQVNHPDAIEQVLVTDARRFRKDLPTRKLDVILGDGLLSSEGAHWKRQRKLASPALSRRQVAAYADAMVQRTRDLAATFAAGQRRDVQADMMALTLDIVADSLFDTDISGHQVLIGEAIEALMEDFVLELRSWRQFVPERVPLPSRRRRKRYTAELNDMVFRLIADKRRAGAQGDDLVSRLLRARDEHGESMTDVQLRDEVLTMVAAGHETTALTLSYALMLLSRHPALQDRARAEVREVLGERAATIDDMGDLRLVDAVVRESMRLLPPAWIIGREPLEPTEVAGVTVKPGEQVVMPQWVVHRDPRWFDAPERFDPDRWLDGRTDTLPRFAYFPFGGGPRICIGNHFAMMEAQLVLATLLQTTGWRPAPGFHLDLFPSITLRPRGGLDLIVSA